MLHKESLSKNFIIDNVKEKISNRQAQVGIIGLGYVGLPMAIEFAEAGFSVLGLDLDTDKVKMINAGQSYVADVPTSRIEHLVKTGKLTATTDPTDLYNIDTINICVPTPLDKIAEPDMSYMFKAIDVIREIVHEGLLVILVSTTYPGTTTELIVPMIESEGFVIGESVFVAFSPERIDPGNKSFNVHTIPKVVGGTTENCSEIAAFFYRTSFETVVTVSSPNVAEMVKLLENTFRAVNIGLANEMTLICDKLGINVWQVVKAASTKPFGYMPFYPGPGIGGHCIPIDPQYLSWKLKQLNYTPKFIDVANKINAFMPHYTLAKIADALNFYSKSIKGSVIVVLGIAYKPNIDDVRESPALEIIALLEKKGATVMYNDPYIASVRLENGEIMKSTSYSDTLLEEADCIVVTTNHEVYDWMHVATHSRLVIDTRNSFNGISGKAHIVSI